MSIRALDTYYLSKWKPFRYALISSFVFFLFLLTIMFYFHALNNIFSWISILLISSISFLVVYLVLIISTLLTLWLKPPQNGQGINPDWWKP